MHVRCDNRTYANSLDTSLSFQPVVAKKAILKSRWLPDCNAEIEKKESWQTFHERRLIQRKAQGKWKQLTWFICCQEIMFHHLLNNFDIKSFIVFFLFCFFWWRGLHCILSFFVFGFFWGGGLPDSCETWNLLCIIYYSHVFNCEFYHSQQKLIHFPVKQI